MWNTFKAARGQHILFQFIRSLADTLSGRNVLPQRGHQACAGNAAALLASRAGEWVHSQTQKVRYQTETFRYSQARVFLV